MAYLPTCGLTFSMLEGDMEHSLTDPFEFGFAVAFGATILGAFVLRFLGTKVRQPNVAQKYALLVTTGFSYGRFTGIEAVADPAIAGTTTGAVTALAILWYAWYFRSRRIASSTQPDGG